jgi:putative Holliday junction resolvase
VDIVTVDTLRPLLQRGHRLLGLDLGTKTIGLALSDIEHRIATPMRTIQRTKFQADAADLGRTCREFAVQCLVIGLPRNMDGSNGPRVQATKAFVRNLHKLLPLPVLYWDERLSTVAAERVLIAADLSRKKRGAIIDQTAAAFILQGALDALNAA